ncbi:ABC transporter substrate-binding protein [Pseudomonas sp. LP_7_YM]|uniref:ABC transporter substrate-binding protein n=1 Tax=Pseudomonas sp. LP_7_YM TaxID=2485137 RepID=UPI0010608B9B|nr:ABC transporter substrate-binding protein [Pseudomonas sp. LP_7_YM]TDV67575.1 iron complex transport system substrate-binding protein [Pseudomonas sp. LP_7_YM]
MSLRRFATLFTGLTLSSAALVAPAASAAPTHYPLTLDNCGVPLTFDHVPQKTVTIGQAATEMLYTLGLSQHIVGTSLWFNQVLPEFKPANDPIERLADNAPSFESVIGKRPDFVPVQFEWMVGPQGAVATRQQFQELKIPTYLLPSDCEGKNNLVGADGTRLKAFRIDTLYKSIAQLAQIFDVQDRGQQLIDSYKTRLAKAVGQAKKHAGNASAVFWFSSPDINVDPYVAGRKGIPNFMLETLGIHNIIDSDEEWPTVGWETIAKANPTILVIARMDRRRFPADDHEKKLAFLKSDPVTRSMDAVKNNRIVIMDASAMESSVRLFDGIEQLAQASGNQ